MKPICRAASSCKPSLIVRGQHFAGHFRSRIDDQPAQLALQLRHRALVLDRARLARLGHDLLRRRDRFLLFALGDVPALARASSIIFCASALALARISA